MNSLNFIGHTGWNISNLDFLFAISTEFVCKFEVGIVSSFALYKETFSHKRKSQLWIHHFVILQLFHPFFLNLDSLCFWNKNKDDFIHSMTSDEQQEYTNIYKEIPNFDYLWLGRNTNG